jgi:hypothetical protein
VARGNEGEDGVITIRPAAERGQTDLGWLDSHHTFSFGRAYALAAGRHARLVGRGDGEVLLFDLA